MTPFTDIKSIKVGDKFIRYKFNNEGKKVSDGFVECTYISPVRYLFRFTGTSVFPDGYILKVHKNALKEAIFNECPGVERVV